VPNARLIVAGSSPRKAYISHIKRYAKRLQVPTSFLGYVSHRNLHKVYWLGDCFVCPSQQHEAFGLVNVEAMASGLPVVASQIGGIMEIVNHEVNGLLVEQYRDPIQFAEYMRRMAEQPDYASKLSEAGREAMEQSYGWDKTAARIEEIYTAVCEKSDME
jgi:spore coat protein SA